MNFFPIHVSLNWGRNTSFSSLSGGYSREGFGERRVPGGVLGASDLRHRVELSLPGAYIREYRLKILPLKGFP